MFGIIGLIIGILLILWGLYMIVFFPVQDQTQPEDIGIIGIVFGFVVLGIGIALVFF